MCCTGATLITAREIKDLFRIFPLTIGFRKYRPISEGHLNLLESVGLNLGNFFIVGDFIAGNWRAPRCVALNKDNYCSLHGQGLKPLQCQLVPFCAVYPEDAQYLVIGQRRQESYSRCLGFVKAEKVVWEKGSFVDDCYRYAFYGYQQALMRQRDFMVNVLRSMRGTEPYKRFLKGSGILEIPILSAISEDLMTLIGFTLQETESFLITQRQLMQQEAKLFRDSVFADALTMPPYSDTINENP